MGLDMYFFSASPEQIEKTSDVSFKATGKRRDDHHEIQYFRKHNQLNGWLESLYHEKGGKGDFNCSTMIMNDNDFKRLRMDIRGNKLAPASGFFWGDLTIDKEVKKQYYAFIKEARKRIANGEIIYYYPNW
jgi:hypothetical protein